MSTLRAAPYSLAYGSLVVAKVRAKNSIGFGAQSSENASGASIQTPPVQMAAPARGSSTSESQIEVTCTPLTTPTETGGSTITSYFFEWDKGTATWEELTGFTSNSLATSFTVTSGVVGGTTYSFRVTAKNAHGWGTVSATTSIKAAGVPDSMAAVTTSVQGTTDVRISWAAPDFNSEALTGYKILIKQNDGSFSEDTTNCVGTDPTIMSQLYCDVPMSTLRASPYSLTYGALVVAKAYATNSIGNGGISPENSSGATIQTPPTQMATPQRGASTTESSLHVTWSALSSPADTGGAVIDSYNIQWDKGTSTWEDLGGQDGSHSTALTITHASGVVAGTSYKFRVRAHNAHGWGDWSSEATVVAAGVPDAPAAPTTSIDNTNVKIQWTAPDANSGSIDGYRVYVADSTATYHLESTYCDGLQDPVKSQLYCLIPMTILRSSPYSLAYAATIEAKVEARN